jgi:thiosulfate dehydrogenase [quinone] large subunit
MKETTGVIGIAGGTWDYRRVDAAIPALTLLLRLTFGFYFVWSGFDKLITHFTAQGFLLHSTQGPLKDLFMDMGQSGTALNLIDPLVVYGQILIGLALIFGLFTRFALFAGIIQLSLFYLAQLWPANNPFLDQHIFYILTMGLLAALGAGRVFGLDGVIERWEPIRRVRPLQYALG